MSLSEKPVGGLPLVALICALWLFAAGQSFARQTPPCEDADLARKAYALEFREELLNMDSVRLALFKETTAPMREKIEQIVEARHNIRDGNLEDNTSQLCRELDKINAAADDILSGGGGTGKLLLTPWKKHTPEEMVALHMELTELCGHDFSGCESQTSRRLNLQRERLFEGLQNGEMQYPVYLDKLTGNLQQAVDNFHNSQ